MTLASPHPIDVVLVIDDDEVSLELMSRSLTRVGVRVVTATSGEEGLRLAREIRPQAIFLDVVMPGLDGWAVLSRLKSDPEVAGIPVVIMTMLDERKKALALGANDFCLKPVDRSRLTALLGQARMDRSPSTPTATT